MTQSNSVNQLPQAINPAIIARSLNSLPPKRNLASVKQSGCQDCRLHDLCLSKEFGTAGFRKLSDVIKPSQALRKGQHLYRQGDDFKSIYFIRNGAVKSYITSTDGEEVAVSFFLPSETIGLDGVYNKKYSSSIVAVENTFYCELPFAALEKLMSSQPVVQQHFNQLLSRQIIREQSMTVLRGQKTAADRLTAFLLDLSGRYARIRLSSRSFRLPMGRIDIAGCIGLTHETVSRLFSVFQEQDWLEVSGREVTLTKMPGLNAVK